MTPRGLLLTWLGLLLMLAAEIAAATWLGWGNVAPVIGLAMAALVAFTFMRLNRGIAVVRIFALAGMFWLLILLGLGSLDPFTRSDLPTMARSQP